jgi:hypothetical protein
MERQRVAMRGHRLIFEINGAVPAPSGRDGEDMIFLWILLGVVYVACWIFFGLATFSKGHYWLFWIGFFLPILWIIGAMLAPTQSASARAAAGGG